MTPRHVCHLRFSDVVGGVETHILALIPALDPDRWTAEVITFPNPPFEERLRAAGIAHRVIARRGFKDVGFIWRLRRLLRSTGCRIVHTHGVFSDLYAGLAGRFQIGRPRHILTKHTFADADHSMPRRKAKAFDRLDRWVTYPRVDRIVAISEERRRGLMERQGVPSSKIAVIHCGAPFDDSLDPAKVRPILRAELGLSSDTPVIGFSGRLNPEKGPDVFIEIMARLIAQRPDAHGIVLGDGPMRSDLEQRVQAAGISDRIHFLSHRSDVPNIVADLDIFIMPSRTEGLPMMLLEAMALERPVVASDVGGLPEVIDDRISGLLCPVEGVEEFADATLNLIGDSEQRRALGAKARQTVFERHTAKVMAEKTMALYDQTLGGA